MIDTVQPAKPARAAQPARRASLLILTALVAILAAPLAAPLAPAQTARATPPAALPIAPWEATWGTAVLQPYGSEILPPTTFNQTTLRQVVHVSAGGAQLRLRLSNVFGEAPLVLASVHIARTAATAASAASPAPAATGAIAPGSSILVTFGGRAGVSIPMGAEYLSDPVAFPLPPLSDLVIDLEIASAPASVTLHTGARATSFLASGSHAGEPTLPSPITYTRWYFLSGVEIPRTPAGAAVVTLGDSITDGHAATTDGNDRWPDVLARRLAADPRTSALGVVNAGIGGNHLLYDGLGPNALARFDRDVLARPGVRFLIVLEGINDLGGLDRLAPHDSAAHAAWLAQIEAALAQIVARAHAQGILVFGATLTPYLGSDYYHPSPASEADRVALNQWIRTPGAFDAVIDFDAAVRDPAHPDRMLSADDSGDHLHPGPAGYRRMGEAIPLALFTR